MRKVLAFILVLILIVVIVQPAKAVALDPVSFLYPIWQAFGQFNGLSIVTSGGNDFTQSAFPSLFNEWQQSKVDNGSQGAVQTMQQWVTDFAQYVAVRPAIIGAKLNTALHLGSELVKEVTEFWNWVIVDKLGGSSVDAINFSQQSGNLYFASSGPLILNYMPDTPTTNNYFLMNYLQDYGTQGGQTYRLYYASRTVNADVLAFIVRGGSTYTVFASKTENCSVNTAYVKSDGTVEGYTTRNLSNYSRNTGFYWIDWQSGGNLNGPCPVYYTDSQYTNVSALREHIFQLLANDGFEDGGSITVEPDTGVSSLGFSDASDSTYIPSDSVIPWNVPYDQTKGLDDYLDDAYNKALDNTLTDDVSADNPPVEGSGTVGDVDEYLAPGLAEVFPFCIPFDVYSFLEALAAEPEAPSFTAQLAFPQSVGGTKEIEIDFDTPEWNAVAQVLRTFELLLFIVGLAVVTREKFIRS